MIHTGAEQIEDGEADDEDDADLSEPEQAHCHSPAAAAILAHSCCPDRPASGFYISKK